MAGTFVNSFKKALSRGKDANLDESTVSNKENTDDVNKGENTNKDKKKRLDFLKPKKMSKNKSKKSVKDGQVAPVELEDSKCEEDVDTSVAEEPSILSVNGEHSEADTSTFTENGVDDHKEHNGTEEDKQEKVEEEIKTKEEQLETVEEVSKEEKTTQPEKKDISECIQLTPVSIKMVLHKGFMADADEKWPELSLNINDDSTVTISGPKEKVTEVKSSLEDFVNSLVQAKIPENPSVLGLLALEEAKMHVKNVLEGSGTVAFFQVSGKDLLICSESDSEKDVLLDVIQTELVHKEIPLEECHRVLVGMSHWEALLEDLQEQYKGLVLPIVVQHDEDEEEQEEPKEEEHLENEANKAAVDAEEKEKEEGEKKDEDKAEQVDDSTNQEKGSEGKGIMVNGDATVEVVSKSEVKTEVEPQMLKVHVAAVKHVADDIEGEIQHFLTTFSWDQTMDIPAGLARVLYKGLQMDVRRIEKICGVTIESAGHGVQTKLVVSGDSKSLAEAEKALKDVTSKVITRKYKTCRPGLGKFFFSEAGLELLGRLETKYRLAIHPELGAPDLELEESTREVKTVTKPKHPLWDMFNSTEEKTHLVTTQGTSVKLSQGCITKSQADVILNSTSRWINLNSGKLTSTILKAAGPELSRDCSRVTPWFGLREGQVVSTQGRKLPCKYILHASGSSYHKPAQSERVLRLILKNAFARADELGCHSLALPAFGCGYHGIPPTLVARAILEQIVEYSKGFECTPKIRDVYIVVPEEDSTIMEAMVNEFDQLSGTPRARCTLMPDGRKRRHHQDFPSLLEGYMSSLPRSVASNGGPPAAACSSVTFHLHSLSEDTLDLVQEALDKHCKNECKKFVVSGDKGSQIKDLDADKMRLVEQVGEPYSVQIRVDQSGDEGIIILEGLEADITEAADQVNKLLNEATRLEEVAQLETQVQWEYETEEGFQAYSGHVNKMLESAYLNKEENVGWSEEGGTLTYSVNLSSMEESCSENPDKVQVRRNTQPENNQ